MIILEVFLFFPWYQMTKLRAEQDLLLHVQNSRMLANANQSWQKKKSNWLHIGIFE